MIRLVQGMLLFGALVVFAQPAEAFVVSHGEEIDLVHDLPDTPEYFNEGGHWDVGYMYYQYSVLFMPVWASDGEGRFVLYNGDRYIDLPPEALAELQTAMPGKDDVAAGYSFNAIGHMWGLLIWVPLIGIGVLFKFLNRNAGVPMSERAELAEEEPLSTESFDERIAARLQETGHAGAASPATNAPGGFGTETGGWIWP